MALIRCPNKKVKKFFIELSCRYARPRSRTNGGYHDGVGPIGLRKAFADKFGDPEQLAAEAWAQEHRGSRCAAAGRRRETYDRPGRHRSLHSRPGGYSTVRPTVPIRPISSARRSTRYPRGTSLYSIAVRWRRLPGLAQMLARRLVYRGCAGLVLDGGVRDTADIAQLGLPTYCMGPAARPIWLPTMRPT
jgi:hypothetical protein